MYNTHGHGHGAVVGHSSGYREKGAELQSSQSSSAALSRGGGRRCPLAGDRAGAKARLTSAIHTVHGGAVLQHPIQAGLSFTLLLHFSGICNDKSSSFIFPFVFLRPLSSAAGLTLRGALHHHTSSLGIVAAPGLCVCAPLSGKHTHTSPPRALRARAERGTTTTTKLACRAASRPRGACMTKWPRSRPSTASPR